MSQGPKGMRQVGDALLRTSPRLKRRDQNPRRLSAAKNRRLDADSERPGTGCDAREMVMGVGQVQYAVGPCLHALVPLLGSWSWPRNEGVDANCF